MSGDMTNAKDFLKIGPFVKEARNAQQLVTGRKAKRSDMTQTQTQNIGLFRKYLLDKAQQYVQFRDTNFREAEATKPQQPTCGGLLPYQNTARRPSFLEQELLPEMRNGCVPTSDGSWRGQLTIFYSGTINVYDNVPVEKANAIMLLAGEGSMPNPASPKLPRPPVPTNISASSQRKVPSARKIEAGNVPVARKHSLQQFLEKRRDRITSKAPYANPKQEVDQELAKENQLRVEEDLCLTPCLERVGCL